MNRIQLDQAAECIKRIVDNNRCPLCDRADGLRFRYACGHLACDECIITAVDCLTCLTPPKTSNSAVLDREFTKRVENTCSLLKAGQALFNIDVFKRQRLSEQLKVEKELFPKCIQAPVKYENKRKSSTRLSKDKENKSTYIFPGENISTLKSDNMENSFSYVQQWLSKNDKNLTRRPFADLSVNQSFLDNGKFNNSIPFVKSQRENVNKFTALTRKPRKRAHYKTITKQTNLKSDDSLINSTNDYSKKLRKDLDILDDSLIQYDVQKKNEDESGIVIDDEPILIDDSQDTISDSQEAIYDKDKQAWLAVIEASKKEELASKACEIVETEGSQTIEPNKQLTRVSAQTESPNQTDVKVPFFKKSYLSWSCQYCRQENKVPKKLNDVKITIESDHFLTTVKVTNEVQSVAANHKKSVPVQTTISEILQTNIEAIKDTVMNEVQVEELRKDEDIFLPTPNYECKEDILVPVKNTFDNIPQTTPKRKIALVIAESDSDEDDIENSGPIQVTADIHRSCEEDSGVLAEVDNQEAHDARPRHAPRGHTPTSTDSSEKENYNPNRRRNKFGKKKHGKK